MSRAGIHMVLALNRNAYLKPRTAEPLRDKGQRIDGVAVTPETDLTAHPNDLRIDMVTRLPLR